MADSVIADLPLETTFSTREATAAADREYSGNWMKLLMLSIGMAIGGYTRVCFSPVQETLRVALDLTDNQTALLQGPALGIPILLMTIPIGILVDHYSRVRLLLLILCVAAAGNIIASTVSSFYLLLAVRGIVGLTASASVPLVFSLLADLYAPSARGRATTIVCIGQLLGNSLAFAAGGKLLSLLPPTAEAWRNTVFWLNVPIIPLALAMALLREPRRIEQRLHEFSLAETWRLLKNYKGVVAALVAGGVMAQIDIGSVHVWAAPMLSRRFGLPIDEIGATLATGILISGVLGPIAAGAVADYSQMRGGPRRASFALALLGITATPIALLGLSTNATIVIGSLIATLTLVTAMVVMGLALATVVIPNDLRGVCISLLMGAEAVANYIVAPVAVSGLSKVLGGSSTLGTSLAITCALACAASALVYAVGRRYFPSSACA
jgi:MFS family permease